MDRKQEVRDLMFRTEMARKRRIHPVWTDMGLIAGQPRVLSQLFIKDKITQKELAEACCKRDLRGTGGRDDGRHFR